MIGRILGHLVDRNDAERRVDVEGLEGAGEGAGVELCEATKCISHDGSPLVETQGPFPAMSRALSPHRAPLSPRAGERPKRSGGPGRRKNLERSGREEAGLVAGRGNFFRRTGWER